MGVQIEGMDIKDAFSKIEQAFNQLSAKVSELERRIREMEILQSTHEVGNAIIESLKK